MERKVIPALERDVAKADKWTELLEVLTEAEKAFLEAAKAERKKAE